MRTSTSARFEEGGKSPDGQAFVLELVAAHRDWVDAGSQGANAGVSVRMGKGVWGSLGGRCGGGFVAHVGLG